MYTKTTEYNFGRFKKVKSDVKAALLKSYSKYFVKIDNYKN